MRQKSSLFTIFLIVFIDLLGFGIVVPYLPSYAVEKFKATNFEVGLLMASFSFMQFIFAPIWGGLSDRKGRRPILIMSLAGASLSYWILGIANTLPLLFFSRLLSGTAAANISTAQAYVSDITTPENRAKGMGMIGAAFGLGFIFGPAIGGGLSHVNYALPAYFGCGLSALAMVMAVFLLPESLQPSRERVTRGRQIGPRAILKAFTHPHLSLLFVIFFIFTFSFSCYETTFPLVGLKKFGFHPAQIGLWFAYVGVVTAGIQGGLIGRLAKRYGERKLIILGVVLTIIGIVFIPYSPSMMILGAVLLSLGIGAGITNPSLSSFISLSTEATEQGSVLGMSQSLSSLARILGPIWGGFGMQHWGFGFPYLTCGGLLALALLSGLRLLNARVVVDQPIA
ncbi:MAG: MFS transporter [Acidobacteriia bacterium]|nr:MFS transporter [Terriglobia bacterium]